MRKRVDRRPACLVERVDACDAPIAAAVLRLERLTARRAVKARGVRQDLVHTNALSVRELDFVLAEENGSCPFASLSRLSHNSDTVARAAAFVRPPSERLGGFQVSA